MSCMLVVIDWWWAFYYPSQQEQTLLSGRRNMFLQNCWLKNQHVKGTQNEFINKNRICFKCLYVHVSRQRHIAICKSLCYGYLFDEFCIESVQRKYSGYLSLTYFGSTGQNLELPTQLESTTDTSNCFNNWPVAS